VKGYPNPGMPERPGLIGAADGGTLFLDEIGEQRTAIS
jgi:transcriptional regulator with PAS, ATPase and Fis domain